MSFLYKSKRVGKGGSVFTMYKIRTLKETSEKFAKEDGYTRFGWLLRKTKTDELPQLWNIIRGDMRFFGYRAEEEQAYKVLPEAVKSLLKREKPGLIDLSSVHFYDEERLLQSFSDPHKAYWEIIRPMKFTLQAFYMENRSIILNLAICWMYLKKLLFQFLKK